METIRGFRRYAAAIRCVCKLSLWAITLKLYHLKSSIPITFQRINKPENQALSSLTAMSVHLAI
jgi:hypothetical protein